MDKLLIRWRRRQRVQQERKEEMKKKGFSHNRFQFLSLCMVMATMLSLSCFATDPEPVTVSGLLSDATPTVTTAMSSVWTLMTSNPISTFALGCAILSVGFRFIRKAIRVSHKA